MDMDHSSCRSKRTTGVERPLLALACLLLASCSQNEQGYVRAKKKGEPLADPVVRTAFDAEAKKDCRLQETPSTVLERQPYLQSVGPSQAIVMWSSDASTRAKLHWWIPGTEFGPRALSHPVGDKHPYMAQQHMAMASGLRANQRYCYEILHGETAVFSGSFQTAPDTVHASVRMSVMGDLGKNSPDQRALREVLEGVPSDLLLITGDVAYDAGRLPEFDNHFFRVFWRLLAQVPVFPASGNHDYASDGAWSFRQVFELPRNGGTEGEERWYSFDWGPAHIAVLDTERSLDEQARWLSGDLERHDRPWQIVVLHRPPYSSGSHGGSAAVAATLVPVFANKGVDLVLAGHDHDYERSVPLEGVVYVVTGGGGRGTRPVGRSEFTAFSERVAHLVYLEVDASTLRLRAIDASGQEFDGLELSKK